MKLRKKIDLKEMLLELELKEIGLKETELKEILLELELKEI